MMILMIMMMLMIMVVTVIMIMITGGHCDHFDDAGGGGYGQVDHCDMIKVMLL